MDCTFCSIEGLFCLQFRGGPITVAEYMSVGLLSSLKAHIFRTIGIFRAYLTI